MNALQKNCQFCHVLAQASAWIYTHGSLLVNNLLLSVAAAMILPGTLYPLTLDAPREAEFSVDTRLNVGLYRDRVRELETRHGVGTLDAVPFEPAEVEAARESVKASDAQGGAL